MGLDLATLKAKVEVLENDLTRAQAGLNEYLGRVKRGEIHTSDPFVYGTLMTKIENLFNRTEDLIQAYRELVKVLWEREGPEPP